MPPGRAASHYIRASPSLSNPSFLIAARLFCADSQFVLYSVEGLDTNAPHLVFLELSPEARRKMWKEEAFIDRGIRKLVELGSQVVVMSLETAEDFAKSALASFASGEWQLSFVWNTGRCGSTLLHKAVSAMGTASFSEPHWLDQLLFNPSLEPASVERALRVCVAIDARTARLQTAVPGWARPTNFVFNPKAGGMKVAAASVAAFPRAHHAFMYRACHKVVESFGGLKYAGGVPAKMAVAWRLLGLRALPGPPPPPGLPLAELSSIPVAMLTARWISIIRAWCETTAERARTCGAADPLASAVVIRMDEFTSKDLVLRQGIMGGVLAHFGIAGAATDMRPALDVFSVHSQAGSKMSGPKAKIVTANDVEVIKRCVVAALSTHATVQEGGANVALPRSLGVAA